MYKKRKEAAAMDEKEAVKTVEEGALKKFRLEANKALLKKALLNIAEAENRPVFTPRQPSFYFKIAAAAAVIAGFTAAMILTVFDNMDDGDRFNKNGGIWSTYSDAHQGGDSVVWPPETNDRVNFVMSAPGYGETGFAVRVTGRAGNNLGSGYNYFGLVARFNENSACPQCRGTDISKYKGIVFRVKGNLKGAGLSFVLPYESGECVSERNTCKSLTEYADYQIDITGKVGAEWGAVMIDFREDLQQPYWAGRSRQAHIENVLKSVHLFKWQLTGGSGETAELWIDDIQLY